MQLKLREWAPVVLLALVPALPLLLGSGMVNTRAGGDSPFLLVRVHQLVQNLRAGVFPARWMPQAAYGLGYPFFNFYASLPYYMAAAAKLVGLGYILSIKLTQALGFVCAAIALYGFATELQPQKRAANLLVALIYSCAPFHMVNVYVRGDSLSEFYAFVFFPLILWGLLRLHKRSDIPSMVWVALSYAGLIVTHNISALIFSPLALLYALCLAWEARDVKRLMRSIVALGAGVAASSWYWLPALAERGSVYLKDMTTGYFHYAQHFRAWDLVQRSLSFDYAITADQQPFRMGLLQALLAIGGCVAIVTSWIRERCVRSQGGYLLVLLAASTFMITPLSQPLWDRIPILPLVQFPWRFLSLQALASSLVVAYLVPKVPDKKGSDVMRVASRMMAPALGLLVLGGALLGLRPERLLIEEADVTTQRLMLYEYFTANVGTTIRTDYLPTWVAPRPYTSEAFWHGEAKPAPLAIQGQVVSAELTSLGPASERWIIEVASESLVAFHTYYYPGWEAQVDGRSAQIEPLSGLGYIGLRVPPGRHEVQLQMGRTRAQRFAEAVSAVTAIALLTVLGLSLRHRHGATVVASAASSLARTNRIVSTDPKRVLLRVAPFVAVILLVIGNQMSTLSVSRQKTRPTFTKQLLDLTMDFDRIPYLHHNPDGVPFGDAARLTGYELSSETVRAGEALVVTTHWEGIKGDDLVVRATIVSPAQHLFGVPLVVAADEQPLTADRAEHALRIPSETMRAVALLTLQVYGWQGEIRPVNWRGETLGTTYLMPIRIDNQIPAQSDEPTLQKFGSRIVLSQAHTKQPTADSLNVLLTWNVLGPPTHNYKTALRLRDASDREVAGLDTQPGYGFQPTSMWRTGEQIYDRYLLAIEDGTPPGTQYRLDVTLYEAATLAPIGTARIPGVLITHPTVRQDYPALHTFGPALVLSEAHLPEAQLDQGERLHLSLTWAAQAQMGKDYECRVTLLPEAGTALDYQAQPLALEYPTSLWPPDALIKQYYEVQLTADVRVGQYSIALTVVEAGSGQEVGTFTLPNAIRIIETTRSFSRPEMDTAVEADFGGQIQLLGYDLQREESNLRLKLHWLALSAMTIDYKVFVHLFDPKTETIMAQQDVLAGGDAYPTTRWLAGEVLSDEIELQLGNVPDGLYHLGIGLYHADTRLPVMVPPGFAVSADRLLLEADIQAP